MTITAGMNCTLETISEDAPELHHYTSVQALAGMLSAKSIWATHFSGLNDISELGAFRDALSGPLARRLAKTLPNANLGRSLRYPLAETDGSPSRDVELIAKELVNLVGDYSSPQSHPNSHYRPRPLDPFVASFCTHHCDSDYPRQHGLLSQWRAYAPNGGCCIVFDTAKLMRLLSIECDHTYLLNVFAGKVTYSDDLPGLEEWCDALFPLFAAPLGLVEPHRGNFLASPRVMFMGAMSHLKHCAFSEEREFRISVTPVTESDVSAFPEQAAKDGALRLKSIYVRTSLGREAKYVALFETLGLDLPIIRVIVGPASDQQAVYAVVRRLVGEQTPVALSRIPLVV